MSALLSPVEEWVPKSASEREWETLRAASPQVVRTIDRYLVQLSTVLAPMSVEVADQTLRQLVRWLVAATDVTAIADISRSHLEDYKVWLATQPGMKGETLAKNTQRHRLRMIRIFFERIIEWDWDDAPRRNPLFHGDIAPRTDPLPRFLNDQDAARLMEAARSHRLPRYRLVVEMLARTGMRAGELCDLDADAVTLIGDDYWLGSRSASSATTASSPCTPTWWCSWRNGRRTTPNTSGPTGASWPTTTRRSTVARSTASSQPPPGGPASARSTLTSCATRSPPRPSTGACASRPLPPSWATAQWRWPSPTPASPTGWWPTNTACRRPDRRPR